MPEKSCDTLLLLVGANPLPNYLAARTLKPRRAILLYTPEVVRPKDCLKLVLREVGIDIPDGQHGEVLITDAMSARAVRKAVADLPPGAHLHYTGGTKIMSVHARRYYQCQLPDASASYLDEGQGSIRFDDGTELKIPYLDDDKPLLSLELLFKLHGITSDISENKEGEGECEGPTIHDTLALTHSLLTTPKLASEIYDRVPGEARHFVKGVADLPRIMPCPDCGMAPEKPSPKRLPLTETDFADWKIRLSEATIPGGGWAKNRTEKWIKWLRGTWLEEWLESLVRSLGFTDVWVNVNCRLPIWQGHQQIDERPFEVDVALIHRNRFYLISCTTDAKPGMCKHKLFEAALRARQIGGDLARSALVCFLDGRAAQEVQYDVRALWAQSNTPRVFGLPSLREWAGTEETPPQLDSLRKWLET